MRWPIHGFGAESAWVAALLLLAWSPASAQSFRSHNSSPTAPSSVPTSPPRNGSSIHFRDSHYGVRFQVPPGWTFTRKDREVSTFRLDARTAPPASEMRGVATMNYNPFPQSVLSGALVYFSVARHSNDRTCAAEATGSAPAVLQDTDSTAASGDPESIGGMAFLHGHDEHGGICVEARDEVYTAYRKGSCYRFDLEVNTFCAISSGAAELSQEQMHSLEAQMTGILSTVSLDWEKTGPQPVPVPEALPDNDAKPPPRHQLPTSPSAQKPAVGRGA